METPEQKKLRYQRRNQHPNYQSPERAKKIGEALATRWKNPAFREKMKLALKGVQCGRPRIPVTIDGVNYSSIREASIATGRAYTTLQRLSMKARKAAK